MTASRKWAAVFVLALVFVALVTPGCGSRGVTESIGTASAEVLVCGWHDVKLDGGQTVSRPEIYVLPAMNNKLRHYPEFASTIGAMPGSVSDCGTSRTFYRGYMEYLHAHPGFDLDEVLEGIRPPPPAPPPESANVTIPKIYNGVPGRPQLGSGSFFPVVGLRIPVDGTTVDNINQVRGNFHKLGIGDPTVPALGCSGTVIAKHWITTAAHCVLTRAAWVADPTGDPEKGIAETFGYYGYTIDWADTSGNVLYHLGSDDRNTTVRINLLQVPDTRWVGLDPSQGYPESASHDFALLYVPNMFDGTLPPNATTSSWAVSLKEFDFTWNLTAWGWGVTTPMKPDPSLPPEPPVLRSTAIQPFTVSNTNGDSFTARPPTQPGFGTTCNGDSGGPWVRTVTSPDTGFPQRVIVAVSSTLVGGLDRCAVTPPEVMTITAMSHEIDFLTQEMQWWNGSSFQCIPKLSAEGKANGDTAPDYAECFGSPCLKDSDCLDQTYSCSNPSGDPANNGVNACTICDFINGSPVSGTNPGTNDCSCIIGQCLLNK